MGRGAAGDGVYYALMSPMDRALIPVLKVIGVTGNLPLEIRRLKTCATNGGGH